MHLFCLRIILLRLIRNLWQMSKNVLWPFRILTITTPSFDLIEGQWHFLLGHAVDLKSIMWIIGMCLTIQSHVDGYVLTLRSKNNDQGTMKRNSRRLRSLSYFFPWSGKHWMSFTLNVFSMLWPRILGEQIPKRYSHKCFNMILYCLWIS